MTFSRRRNGRSRSRRQGPHPGRQAFPAAGRRRSRPRAGGFPYCRPASLSCRWNGGLPLLSGSALLLSSCGGLHLHLDGELSLPTAANVLCRRAPSFSRRRLGLLRPSSGRRLTAGRQVSPLSGSALPLLLGGKLFLLSGGKFLLPAGSELLRRCARAALLSSSFGAALYRSTGLRVAVQALDKRSVSVDRMAGLSEKGFLPPFGGRPSHTAAA